MKPYAVRSPAEARKLDTEPYAERSPAAGAALDTEPYKERSPARTSEAVPGEGTFLRPIRLSRGAH
jgi:hypothetical protein